jgi:hypothetical protein
MKNIYVLPTDKPSRLFNCFGKLEIGEFCATREDLQVTNQHIYITSTEEITDCNCYVINVIGDEDTKRYVFKPIEVTEDYVRKQPMVTYPSGGWCEKIILTTDPDLIKDGVQSIDDEFLEWFVSNPSCEFVEVKPLLSNNGRVLFGYKIIIPKEEPCDNCNNEVCCIIRKQETLEEITEQIQNECHSFVESVPNVNYQDATNTFLFMKLAELTLKLKNYETRS